MCRYYSEVFGHWFFPWSAWDLWPVPLVLVLPSHRPRKILTLDQFNCPSSLLLYLGSYCWRKIAQLDCTTVNLSLQPQPNPLWCLVVISHTLSAAFPIFCDSFSLLKPSSVLISSYHLSHSFHDIRAYLSREDMLSGWSPLSILPCPFPTYLLWVLGWALPPAPLRGLAPLPDLPLCLVSGLSVTLFSPARLLLSELRSSLSNPYLQVVRQVLALVRPGFF